MTVEVCRIYVTPMITMANDSCSIIPFMQYVRVHINQTYLCLESPCFLKDFQLGLGEINSEAPSCVSYMPSLVETAFSKYGLMKE